MRRLHPRQLCPSEALPLGYEGNGAGLRGRFVLSHDAIFLYAPIAGPSREICLSGILSTSWEIVPSGGKRKQELRMFGLKRPTRIDLRSNDAAIVVRENGEMEMFIRQAKGDEELPPGQVVLALFGMAFHDERVRKLLAQIVKEKQNLT
jgi:hypothetical protein